MPKAQQPLELHYFGGGVVDQRGVVRCFRCNRIEAEHATWTASPRTNAAHALLEDYPWTDEQRDIIAEAVLAIEAEAIMPIFAPEQEV